MVEGASRPYAQALVRAKTLAYLEREKPKKQLFSAATLSMVLDTVGTSPTNLSTIDILRKYVRVWQSIGLVAFLVPPQSSMYMCVQFISVS